MNLALGFTGTSSEVTSDQKRVLHELILDLKKIDRLWQFHHGDCINADALAHRIMRENSIETTIVVHPPINDAKRAFCKGDRVMPVLPYLVRNQNIVNYTKKLIAMPKGPEELRSGTWATVRYARKMKREIFFIWPDGRLTREM